MTIQINAKFKRSREFGINVDLNLDENKIMALFGKSGSGKSSILRYVAGFEKFPNNFLRVNETILQDKTSFVQPEHRQIGYVFQSLNLFTHLSTEGNLRFASKRSRAKPFVSESEVIEILDLKDLLKKFPSSLSGGEQQRLAIGRSLLSNPSLILLDEPLSWLDTDTKLRILDYLKEINKKFQVPMIFVSHSADEVLLISDRIYEIEDGKNKPPLTPRQFSLRYFKETSTTETITIDCKVCEYDSINGLTRLNFEEESLYVEQGDLLENQTIKAEIKIQDIVVTRFHTEKSSVLNQFSATVHSINDPGNGAFAIIEFTKKTQSLSARVPRKSLQVLSPREKETLFIQINNLTVQNKR